MENSIKLTIGGNTIEKFLTDEDIKTLLGTVKEVIPTVEIKPPVVEVKPPVIEIKPITPTQVEGNSYNVSYENGKYRVSWNIKGGSGNYSYRLGSNIYSGNMETEKVVNWDVTVIDNNTKAEYPVKVDTSKLGVVNFNGTTSEKETPIVVQVVTTPTQTQTVNSSNRPLVGAIRWDWWTDNFHCTNLWLSPNKYHYKVPFFAKETGNDSLTFQGATQEIVDKELEYANYAGLDYFAFVWYEGFDRPTTINGSYGRELFKLSTKKGKMKMAYILDENNFKSHNLKKICLDFGRDDYQKINGRPLFFYLDKMLNPTQVGEINKTYLQLYPNAPLPYLVNAVQVGVQEAQQNNKTGVTAWSQYTGYRLSGDTDMRERYKKAGVKLIPTLTVGWHTSPIGEQPCSWYQNAPIEPEFRLTGNDLKNHLIDTINFVSNNPDICEANSILCYAWNEHAEGGYISPTIVPNTNNIDTSIIEVFKSVLRPSSES